MTSPRSTGTRVAAFMVLSLIGAAAIIAFSAAVAGPNGGLIGIAVWVVAAGVAGVYLFWWRGSRSQDRRAMQREARGLRKSARNDAHTDPVFAADLKAFLEEDPKTSDRPKESQYRNKTT